MARPLIPAVVCLLALIAGCRPRSLQREEARTLSEWLNGNCATEGQERLRADLVRHAAALEPYLVKAFVDGPPKERIERVAASASAQFQEIEVAYRDGKAGGKGRPPREAGVAPFTRDWFIGRVKRNFEESYRAAALNGLGMTGGRDARRLLERVAADAKSAFQEDAVEILRQRK